MEAYMNKNQKLENSGAYPTYLNLASPNTKFQIRDDISAHFVDFSSCSATYIVKQEHVSVPQQHVKYR
jgi:hypothetical protein